MVDDNTQGNLMEVPLELREIYRKDYSNLSLLAEKATDPDEVARLTGKAEAARDAIAFVSASLHTNREAADAVIQDVIDDLIRTKVESENRGFTPDSMYFAAGYMDGLHLAIDKARRERRYV